MSEQEEIDIFKFIKKSGEKENEVKSALDIIQFSLSGLQSEINLMGSRLHENNKTVKDLAYSMAEIQMMLDDMK